MRDDRNQIDCGRRTTMQWDYLFRFSRFACLFSLADFCGCFFLSFFASWDLDISFTSL